MIKKLRNGIVITISLLAISVSAQRKCGTMGVLEKRIKTDNSILTKIQNSEINTQKWITNNSRNNSRNILEVVTIPVVVHVLWHTQLENISDEQIQSQIDVLNQDFSETNADALPSNHPFYNISTNSLIQFCLASRDSIGNATNGITRTYTDSISYEGVSYNVKNPFVGGKKVWQPTKYLNIWVCKYNEGDVRLGYATFPADLINEYDLDGVVMRHDAFGTIGTAGSVLPNNNLGRTTTHEVGHWLNLRHIWGDAQPNCGDDFVDDTVPSNAPNYGCANLTFPLNPNNQCGSADNGEMYMNYMDYPDDACLVMFTVGQAERMVSALNNERIELLSSLGCSEPLSVNLTDLKNSISVFPNPTKGILNFSFDNKKTEYFKVTILDMLGKKIISFADISNVNSKIDLSGLTNGTYLLNIETQYGNDTKKIIISK